MSLKKNKNASKFKIVSAAIIGHALEFYDFTIYAVFAVVLGKLFFPNSSELAQILSSMGVFAAGFLMRPLGGILFGHIGDKFGRKTSLTISVVAMAVLTFIIGLLPDYSQLGILAPIILVMIRLLQGLCVGGEAVGASVFVLEHLNKAKPGLIGGMVNSALTVGILLAIITGYTLNNYFGENSDAWRYAFFLGGVLGVIGLYIRLSVDETPEFEEARKQNKIAKLPIQNVFKQNARSVVFVFTIGAFTSTSNYMVMSYLNVFFKTVMLVDSSTAMLYSIFGNSLLVIALILGGILSDRLGYARQIAIGAAISLIFSPMIFGMLGSNDVSTALFAIVLLVIQAGIIYAPLYGAVINLFPAEQRYSGIAFSLNFGIAIFGGPSTMISLWLIDILDTVTAPALFLNITAIMYLIALALTQRVSIAKIILNKHSNNKELATQNPALALIKS